ncbi:peroxisomal membrane protein PMP47B [Schizothecium vesticola]|uniref:Peroxisomal membrane protein PMP47B n=1 Tax=Schizothecium vesticola TaxID=314040 RepID=A0AA40EK09_9PEZI|nr:peroxisomal membrane protein PMP47B [Schizothecium vesticola]
MSTPPTSDNVAHALAGAGGGILSMALTYPLITLSTRAQVESARARTTLLAAIRHIIAREGALGLYSGLSSALFGISVTNFVYYYWYEFSRAFFLRTSPRPTLSTLQSILAGLLAGSATVVLTNPIWVVNTRVTTGKGQGAVGTLLALLRDEGPTALFSGVVPALVLVMNPILQYTLFEQLKNAVERRRGRVTPGMAFVLGAVGKLFATGVTYPYITVKSQMHVRGAAGRREGVVEALRRVVREEGWGGLYKGIGPKLTQSVLTAALLFAFKDALYAQSVRLRAVAARRKALA